MAKFDTAAAERVRAAAGEVIEEHHVPGISIGVVEQGGLVFAEGFGRADIEGGQPQDPARRQRIASITKTMVGLCVMALVDEGRLSLDDRVRRLLPEVRFDGPAEAMTVRHLLTHTSGIGEAATAPELADAVNPDRQATREPGDFSTMFPNGVTVEAEPGTKWAYCNIGYGLLGEIVVRAEGALLMRTWSKPLSTTLRLHNVLHRRIFGPLGMTNSDALDEPHPALTTGYHRAPSDDARELLERAGIPVREEPTVDGHNIRGEYRAEFNKAMLAAGGVQSNVPDMARYAAALLARGRGVVRPETFDAMVGPAFCPDERLLSWGLSFARQSHFGRRSFGHGGAYFGGWNSSLAVFPDEGIAVIQHMNVMLDRPAPAFARIQRAVLGAPPSSRAEAPLDPTVLASAPGVFECPPGRLTNFRPSLRIGRAQLSVRDGELWLHARRGEWKDGVRLLPADPADPCLFVADAAGEEAAHVLLTRDDGGRIDGFRCDELVRMVRTETVAPWA